MVAREGDCLYSSDTSSVHQRSVKAGSVDGMIFTWEQTEDDILNGRTEMGWIDG